MLWETARGENGTELVPLRGHEGEVWDAAFVDGTLVVMTVRDDGTALLRQAKSGEELTPPRGPEGEVWSKVFSSDGKRLATPSSGGLSWELESLPTTVRLWDAESGEELAAIRGQRGYFVSAAFSPDGQLLATAGSNGAARPWDVESGAELTSLRGHEGVVVDAAFSPDGKLVVTAGEDGTARITTHGSMISSTWLASASRPPGERGLKKSATDSCPASSSGLRLCQFGERAACTG